MAFHVYILLCADQAYYVGHTDDVDQRMAQHGDGIGSKYTSDRRPLSLLWTMNCPSRESAFMAERQIKGWSWAKKEALMRGDIDQLAILARGRTGRREG